MKKKLMIILVVVLAVTQYNLMVAYFYLWSFDYHRQQNIEFIGNARLQRSIDHAQYANWNHVSSLIISEYQPKGDEITSRFKRCASFPTGEILLEFITAERQNNGTLKDYLNIVYLKRISDTQYQRIGVFKRFLP
jgi:hypothetical protein